MITAGSGELPDAATVVVVPQRDPSEPSAAPSVSTAVHTDHVDPPVERMLGPADAIAAATRAYRAGLPIDMSALAAELGIGRATLYRWVGNRESLLATVLKLRAEQIFQEAARSASGTGADLVVDALRRFMTTAMSNSELVSLSRREPVLFVRLTMMSGPLVDRATDLVETMLRREQRGGRLELALPARVLAQTIVHLTDASVCASLLSSKGAGAEPGTEPGMEPALLLVSELLGRTTT